MFHNSSRSLPNGLQICAIPFSGVKTVNLRAVVFTGSAWEIPGNNGISHFLEHMMFRGNRQLGNSTQLSLKMEEMGGDLNAVTTFDFTEYWLDFHLDYLDTGIRRFCDFLREPLLENIELERSIILEELKTDYNEEGRLIDLDAVSGAEIWKNSGLGLPVSGTRSSIESLSRSDLEKWYKRFYQPGNMILGIAGDIDIDRTIMQLGDQFPATSESTRVDYPRVTASSISRPLLLVDNKDNQYGLQWCFPTYPLSGDLRICYQLIRRILDDGSSSRLQRLIREEKGLVYDVSADMLYFNNGAMLSINSLIGPDRLPELISVAAELVRDLVQNGVTQEELDLAKQRYRIALDCSQDTPQGNLFEVMTPLIYPDVYPLQTTMDKLAEITLADVNDTLKGLLGQNGTCFAMVGPSPETFRPMLEKELGVWLAR